MNPRDPRQECSLPNQVEEDSCAAWTTSISRNVAIPGDLTGELTSRCISEINRAVGIDDELSVDKFLKITRLLPYYHLKDILHLDDRAAGVYAEQAQVNGRTMI